MNTIKLKLLSFLCIVITLQSCGPGNPGVYKNTQIKSSKLDEFHQLDNQLFEALKANNVHDVENMLSKPMLGLNSYRRTIEQSSLQTQLGSYTLLDEYYIVNNKPSDKYNIPTTATDGNKYIFYCTAITEEMYVAFIIPKTKGDKYMITVTYCKYDYGWRINDLEFAPYTITGKTAPMLYNQAMAQFKKGYAVDAFISLDLADKCMRPNIVWVYPQNTEKMNEFSGAISGVLNGYHYPLVMDKVSTKPRIFQVTHLATDEGVFPSIEYLTKIDLKDTTAIRKEKEEVTKAIGQLFPGVDKDKKYIYFTAFNTLPNGKTNPPFIDMVAKLN